jgi:GNAT superfamily N-acetyltransferase
MPTGMDQSGIVIRRSADFAAALELAREAELEVAQDASEPLALWGAFDSELLVGVVTLAAEGDIPIVGWIAVRAAYRGRDIASRLLAAAEEEARRRGETVLWATARAPGFFIARGYAVVASGEQRDLLLTECRDCRQLDSTCWPQVVRKTLVP